MPMKNRTASKPKVVVDAVIDTSTLEAFLLKHADNKLALTVDEVARLCGMKRSTAYEAVKRGDLPSIRLGRKLFCPVPALARLFIGTDRN